MGETDKRDDIQMGLLFGIVGHRRHQTKERHKTQRHKIKKKGEEEYKKREMGWRHWFCS